MEIVMEPQTLVNILVGLLLLFCGGLGWWLKSLYEAHERLRQQFVDLAVNMPMTYAMKVDIRDLSDAIFARIDKLDEKLDRIAGK